jgi:tetratricopeptide (TPR) repeat protein
MLMPPRRGSPIIPNRRPAAAYNPPVKPTPGRMAAALLVCAILLAPALPSMPALPALPALLVPSGLHAQHAAFRVKGRVVTERGEAIDGADVRLEAFYGYAAGTFAGARTFSGRTNRKGEWNVGGMQPGIWLFEVIAPGYVPETVVLPIRILTTVSMGTSGMALTWDLILKPVTAPDDVQGELLKQAAAAARDGNLEAVRSALRVIPEDPASDFLAAAARIAMVARDMPLARALFLRALERDPSSYRAALGIASMFLLERDFDSASRAFDAARSRTHDKDEQKFLSIAIGDLASIKVR